MTATARAGRPVPDVADLPRTPGTARLVVRCATVLMVLLCAAGLQRRALYGDEVYSAFIASRDLTHQLQILYKRELNMGLYYLLLRPVAGISTQEWWLRLPSVACAAAAVPLTAAVARRFAGPRAGALAAVVMAVSPFAVYYGRFARSYALTLALAAAATLLLLRAVERPTTRRWVGYAAVSTLLVYSQPLSALLLAAHAAAAAVGGLPSRVVRQLALTYVAVGCAIAPVFVVILVLQTGQTSWIPRVSVGQVAGAAADVAGAPYLVPMFVVALGYAAWGVLRGSTSTPSPRWHASVLFCWLLLPPALLVLGSLVKPLLLGRYLGPVVPGLAVLLALSLDRGIARRPRAGWAVAAAAVLLMGGATVHRAFLQPVEEDPRTAASYVLDGAREDDALLYTPAFTRVPVSWYLQESAGPRGAPPDDIAVRLSTRQAGDEYPVEWDSAEIERRLAGRERVWIVSTEDDWHPTPEPARPVVRGIRAGRDWELVRTRTSVGLVVELYRRR